MWLPSRQLACGQVYVIPNAPVILAIKVFHVVTAIKLLPLGIFQGCKRSINRWQFLCSIHSHQ